ncbi:hypothetical protein GUJ93_ZPchr0002g23243 [Zizania palustris]|uniref:DUF4219 domain-containing protein n=1 Tax=Zizania palustris TaxID=103762 RepID=A0A8J5VEG3_ZIZPA|nr:hypothetical protein GUJ93_ZPchr0002g23243 [Zizania palustris]
MEASSWDALRKQARRLEAQLDDQMIAYRKLVSMKSDGSENDIESDIERSLKQLQQVNSQMQTWLSSGSSEVLSHTLTRHMEILQDLTQEFYRLRSSLRMKQQHASLLDFRDFDRAKFDVDNGDMADQALLREQAAISRSSGQMDNVISHAQATLGTLMSQRSTFGGITTKISNVSSRLPTINHILASIRRKKSMDTIILSLVASKLDIAAERVVSNIDAVELPLLTKTKYHEWSLVMQVSLEALELWDVVETVSVECVKYRQTLASEMKTGFAVKKSVKET